MTGDRVARLAFAWALALVLSEQASPEWRLARPIDSPDRSLVLAFANQLGIDRPALIVNEDIHHPLTCQAIRIESVPVVNGNRRTWQRVWITNADWRCPVVDPGAPKVGKWILADTTIGRELGAWRIQDGDRVVDIETPPTLPYRDTQRIFQAIKTGRLLDRLPKPDVRGPLPKVDARSINLIWDSPWHPSLLKVGFRGSNVIYEVLVRENVIELHHWGREIS
jgi:hypothetical protein